MRSIIKSKQHSTLEMCHNQARVAVELEKKIRIMNAPPCLRCPSRLAEQFLRWQIDPQELEWNGFTLLLTSK